MLSRWLERTRRWRFASIWVLAGGLCACAGDRGEGLRSATPAREGLDRVVTEAPAACREWLNARLAGRAYVHTMGDDGVDAGTSACGKALSDASRALAPARDETFGLVDRRAVDFQGISLELAEARACERWPIRPRAQSVLTSAAARGASCRTRRWTGRLTIRAYPIPGRGGEPVVVGTIPIEAGVGRLEYGDVSRLIELGGHGSIWDYAWLELGESGWAGAIDLMALRRIMADVHFESLGQGRGAPGLFARAHPEDPRVQQADALAFEVDLAAQERDYLAVSRGELSPATFLERHVWSPYRSSVAQLRH